MSQVRKDILNGWKEIGGYVCRDIRTVERWEKQRGLPVRRVPGAGRATVYALISELDEWLENSKPDGTEFSSENLSGSPASDPISQPGTTPHSQWAEMNTGILASEEQFPSLSATDERTSTPASVDFSRSSPGEPHRWLTLGRQRLIAGVTLAIAACLICVLASPLVRSHANPVVNSTQSAPNPVAKSLDIPYSSPVPGVDELYLRGIYFYEQRTPQSLKRSLDDFTAAVARDPKYAPAYAGLSDSYNLLREYSVMPDAEAYPKARAAAEHAVALDPSLPQAHASLGFIDFFWSWDTADAEREFRTALKLDPSSSLAHHWYGSMLTHEGRYNEAIEQLDLAQRLEPTSAAILSTRALALGLSGRRGEAVDMLQDVVNETPGVSSPHEILVILSKVQPRDPARFLDETRRVGQLRHSEEMLQVAAAGETAYRTGGEDAMWAAILTAEERAHPGTSNRTLLMADAEAALGHNDAAFSDLTLLAQRRDPSIIGMVLDPALSTLHQDRRFGQLVASIGLPPLAH